METLAKWLMAWCERRGAVFKITGTAGPDDVYLIRYYVLKSKWCNIFIHQFLRSDRDDMHDHPWNFATYLIKGSYLEKRWNPETRSVDEVSRINKFYSAGPFKARFKQNTLVFRKATDLHQVVVQHDLKESEKDQAALTLFVSGPTKREWGFVKEVPLEGAEFIASQLEADMHGFNNPSPKKRVWVDWRTYLGLPPDTAGRG